jgi:hypothetical protein
MSLEAGSSPLALAVADMRSNCLQQRNAFLVIEPFMIEFTL